MQKWKVLLLFIRLLLFVFGKKQTKNKNTNIFQYFMTLLIN